VIRPWQDELRHIALSNRFSKLNEDSVLLNRGGRDTNINVGWRSVKTQGRQPSNHFWMVWDHCYFGLISGFAFNMQLKLAYIWQRTSSKKIDWRWPNRRVEIMNISVILVARTVQDAFREQDIFTEFNCNSAAMDRILP